MNSIQELFQQAQLAEAAYADLSGMNVSTTTQAIIDALTDPDRDGKFSTAQAAAFANEWSVVDQYDNSALFGLLGTGFSATVFKNKATNQYSFAIRGSLDFADFSADKSLITTDGVAVSQLVDMYNYWQRLTHLGVYQAATLTTQSVATGFLSLLYAGSAASVPASLATLFGGATNISSYDVARAVLLSNGYIVEGSTVYQIGSDLSTNVYTDSRQFGSNTLAGQSVSVDGHSLGGHLAMAFSRLFPGATNDVTAINGLGFKIADANVNNLFAALGGNPGFDAGKIQNVYGMEGFEFASMNNGVLQQPGGYDGIYIESAGLIVSGGHSTVQMTDSLALYNLFATLDPSLNTSSNGLATITAILKASSNVAANTLEAVISDLGKLFNVSGVAGFNANEFDTNRDLLYVALNGITAALPANSNFTVRDLSAFSAAQIISNAQADTPEGLAYRYALINANPFVLLGNDTLYDQHNSNGELDLYDPATRQGQLTEQYLKDRSSYLVAKLRDNTVDSASNTLKDVRYRDLETNTTLNPINTELRRITFGAAADEGFSGANGNDHLYGMDGDDTLSGGKGNDYLEGGKDNDTYLYNTGDGLDIILDTDGLGSIIENGITLGAGRDTGDGRTFKWVDANSIEHTYLFLNGDSIQGGDLLIDGKITVKNFKGGDLGIALDAAQQGNPQATKNIYGDFAPMEFQMEVSGAMLGNGMDTPMGTAHTFLIVGTSGVGQPDAQGKYSSYLYTYWKHDPDTPSPYWNYIVDPSKPVANQADWIYGSNGNDRIEAGDGFDHIDLANTVGDDFVDAGTGNDIARGGQGNDVIIGGAGYDTLLGDQGDDAIYADQQVSIETAISNGNTQAGELYGNGELLEGDQNIANTIGGYSGPIRQDRNQSSLSWSVRPSRNCMALPHSC